MSDDRDERGGPDSSNGELGVEENDGEGGGDVESEREDEPDDWFERALREDDSREREPDVDIDIEREPSDTSRSGFETDATGSELETSDETTISNSSSSGLDSSLDTDTDTNEDSNSESMSDTDEDSNSSSDSLFDEDFGAALENVEVPTVDADGEEKPAGFSDLEFGFTGPGESNFDEEIDSALPRIDIGIEGLDRMIQGGVPERSLLVTIGGAGTGKTTFGLQFLNHALENGENAVFITLEETRERVINSAVEKGYPFDEYCEAGQLAVVDMDPVEMANSLASIQSELPRLIEDFDASRLVLDSVSLLEMMYDDRARRRNEIFGFTQSLKDAGVTAMLTSEAAERTTYASRFGIVEYLTDAVFVLQYVRSDAISETRLAIEIQKIRDANHSRETKPYEITDEGISVYQQANLF
ncbi:KaiC domain-containing protein [Natronoglomus mannanivorans]|uniref:KaiC domain-containing protein n=1 Tax=Natronoglomus mannanivorans TaxID=2979990 RepID=A0AAP2YWR6_9EURY|nr:KaiC domain-containing protein [Halobacteria archaeon AArc-xg1-1]